MLNDFLERVNRLAVQRRPKVLIGLYQGRHTEAIADSVRRAHATVADVLVVGQPVEGVPSIEVGPDMAAIHKRMVEVIVSGQVEGVVRGNVEEHGLLIALKDAFKQKIAENELRIQCPLVMKDVRNNIFVLGPGSTVWGRNNEEKILWVDSCLKMLEWFDYKSPKLGFLTSTRKANYKRVESDNPDLLWSYKTWESAEYLVDYYQKKGYTAKNYEIHVEHAIADSCDIICVAEGPIGNGMFRGAMYIGGASYLASPRMAIPFPYEDTSQSEQDFYAHFPFVAAMINGKLTK
jgi:predicted methyltransferase MtxX (methanogen marker protein 4)